MLQGVSKSYLHGRIALYPLDFHVKSGEFVVLVGPSGCGKSTLLRLIAGLEECTTGTLLLDDRDITSVPPAERDIAMVFQNYALYPHMTVRDNIGFGLRVRKVPKEQQRIAIHDSADLLGLGDYLDRKPGQLSGGQRQRVAVARAIVRHPKLFLFDEPLSNLDAALRASTRAELRRLHQRLSATTLYVTHDQVEAMSMADRLVVLRAGRVEQVGTPLEIYRQPVNQFIATFIGSPPMKIVRAVADSGTLQLAGQQWPIHLNGHSGLLHVGFRPEHLSLSSERASNTIPVTILLSEAMGNEILLTCALPDKQELIVRANAAESVSPGSIRHLAIALSQACFFDSDTGHTLPVPSLDSLAGDTAHQITL